MVRRSRRWGAVVATLVCVLACDAAAATGPEEPEHLLLRLSDLPAGYVVGDDSGCGFMIGVDEAPAALEAIDRAHASVGCAIEFNRAWVPGGARPGPRLVDATVFAVASPEGAAKAFDVRETLIDYVTGASAASLRPVPVPSPLGDASAAYATDDALVDGRARSSGVVVVWRSGPLLGLLKVGSRPGAVAPETALALAATQQGRMASPTPITPGENDSTLVPLAHPDLDVPIHWLGTRFDPPGALPPLGVDAVFAPLELREGPRPRAEISYSGKDARTHVSIGLWKPRRFARFRQGVVGRRLFDPGCVAAERLSLRRGRAVIRKERCGRRTDFRFAHAVIGRTVVTVNIPVCTRCGVATRRPRDYETRAGLKAVLRGLVRRAG